MNKTWVFHDCNAKIKQLKLLYYVIKSVRLLFCETK